MCYYKNVCNKIRKKVIAISYTHISVVQHNMGNGVTEPKLAMTDDNIPVVVKTNNCPEGNLVLFNEYFCYRLVILLDIKMPVSGICLIDDETAIYDNCVSTNQFGLGFYSTYLHKSTVLLPTIISMMQNKEDFIKILLFDHLIFNTDRNPGNLLVQYYKKNITLQVIDHSHVFINQAIWDANCLRRAIEEKDYFSTRVLEYNNYLYSMFFGFMNLNSESLAEVVQLFKTKVAKPTIEHLISEIPTEWRPSQTNIDALIEYLLYRIQHMEDICETIKQYLQS